MTDDRLKRNFSSDNWSVLIISSRRFALLGMIDDKSSFVLDGGFGAEQATGYYQTRLLYSSLTLMILKPRSTIL